jgi:hypothetical protein
MSWGSTGWNPYSESYTPTANERESGTRNKKPKASGKGPGRTRPTPETANQREGRVPASSKPYVYPGFDLSSTIPVKGGKGGKGGKGNNEDKKDKIEPRPNVSVSQIQIPLGSGQAITPNIQEAYIKEIERLTLNLISSADGLLFAYNFTSIDKIASYMLEADDASQRSTSVISNIIRSRSDVELSELQIRDRLNDVINLVANTIGDLVPSSTKLASFGMKKDNLDFQGGMPRIDNFTALYDLELKLPELQGFGYDVKYLIECYDIS